MILIPAFTLVLVFMASSFPEFRYAFNPGSPFGLHGLLRFAQRPLWMMTPAFTFDLIFMASPFLLFSFSCFSHHVPLRAADAPTVR